MNPSIQPCLAAIVLLCATLVRPAVAADDPAAPPATAPALPEPMRITLTLDDVPVADALRRLLESAGLPADVPLDPNAQRMLEGVTISAKLVNEPFVVAVIELCRQAGLEPVLTGYPRRPFAFMLRHPPRRPIPAPAATRPAATRAATAPRSVPPPMPLPPPPLAQNRTWMDGPRSVTGPFVIIPQSATRTSSVHLETGDTARDLRLTLTVLPDPALRLFGVGSELRVESATDPAGQSLAAPARPGRAGPIPMERLSPMPTVTVPLRYPDQPRGTLATLRGQLDFTIVARSEPVNIMLDGKAVPGDLKAGPVHFTIGPAQPTGDGVQLPLKITQPFNGTDSWDEIRAIARGNYFDATDSSGTMYVVETHIHSVLSDCYQGTIHVRLPHGPQARDPKAPRVPHRIVWRVPVELADYALPIELKDLPLP